MDSDEEHSEQEDHLIEEVDAPLGSPNRLIVTHDGLLDRSVLKKTEGWMYKKGGAVNARGGFRNWKKRWFVLQSVDFLGSEGFELRYYDAPGGKMKGKVGLNDVDVHSESKSTHKNVKFEFQLILQSGGVLQLSCDKEEEREEWIDTFNVIIAYLRKITTSSTMLLDGYDPMCEDDEESHRIGEELAQNCQAFGPGLFGSEAGQPAQFVIEIHDLMGQKVTRGGMPINASITDGTCLYYVAILENDEGLYFGHYTIGRCGKYQLSIKLNDEHHVFGSPFDIEILPSKTIAKFCTAEGDALEKLSTKTSSTFTITAIDGFGNAKNRGGDPFEVAVMGPAKLIDLQDNGDGTYLCSVEALSVASGNPSSVMISVSLYGKAIVGSPFKPVIIDSVINNTSRAMQSSNNHIPASPSGSLASQPMSIAQLGGRSVGNKDSKQASSSSAHNSFHQDANSSLPPPPKYTPNYQQQPPLNSSPKPLSAVGSRLAPSIDVTEGQSTMSRLERSRQRALMAKSLAESNPPRHAPTSANSNTASNHHQLQHQHQHQHQQAPPSQYSAPIPSAREAMPRPPDSVPRQFATPANPPPPYQPSSPTALESDLALHELSLSQNFAGTATRGSKLSQLAQRSKSTLEAKKMGTQHSLVAGMNDASASSPQPTSRNNFAIELAANLRKGFGRSNAISSAVSLTAQEVEAIELSNRALSNEGVVKRICANADVLNQLFSLFADRIEGMNAIKLIAQGYGGLLRVLELYEIVPTFCSRAEAKTLFSIATIAQRNMRVPAAAVGGGTALEFSFFVKFLILLVGYCLQKSGNPPNVEVNVEVLLSRWGFGDSQRLQLVRLQLNTNHP